MTDDGGYYYSERGCSNVTLNPDENERIDLWSGGDGWFYTGGAFYCPTHDCNLEDPSSKLLL